MDSGIIVAIIAGIASIITTVVTVTVTHRSTIRDNKMLNAKTRILLQILDDRFAMANGKAPRNYQSIMTDFDEYEDNGGNSYVHEKVDNYKQDVEDFENNLAHKEE